MLAQACLCNGLTALRRANLGDKKGLFYSAFFELSIGLERVLKLVLKLVLILDHMARNQLVPPDSKTVEDYGHKLRALFDAAKAVCAARNVTALDGFQSDSLPIEILGFLDTFAHPGGRYSNINKLTGHRHQASGIRHPASGDGGPHRAVGRDCEPDHAHPGYAPGARTCADEWSDREHCVWRCCGQSDE
ncbi:hypothetical protein CKO25_07245 [Thiocapsa imhoffii]|uniref:Uncharacterized protein n=1 Tax=Thiocapsa imhoffii TaxID=382777 RepID=A0A9X0WHY5_9GAMM|nr:hypothetical protein [Thiocapsa imhoffii]